MKDKILIHQHNLTDIMLEDNNNCVNIEQDAHSRLHMVIIQKPMIPAVCSALREMGGEPEGLKPYLSGVLMGMIHSHVYDKTPLEALVSHLLKEFHVIRKQQ